MKFYYDDDADVLYLSFDENVGRCVYMDAPSGAILRVEEKTGRLAGATILHFARRLKLNNLDFPELGGVSLPQDFLKTLRI